MAIITGSPISLVGPKGPVGDQGQSVPALGSLCFAAGPQASLANVAGSANGVTMGVSGTTGQPANYFPPDASAFLGATIISYSASTAAFSFSLVNVGTGATVYTSTGYAANSINTVGVFPGTAYPLVKGGQYQWKTNGPGTIYACVQPFYAMAANTAVAASQVNSFALPSAVTLSGTFTSMYLPGTTSAAYIRLPRSGYVYTFNVVNNAPTAVTVRFQNLTSAATILTQTVAGNTTTTFGPYGPGVAPIAVATLYAFQASGSGAADLQVQTSVVS